MSNREDASEYAGTPVGGGWTKHDHPDQFGESGDYGLTHESGWDVHVQPDGRSYGVHGPSGYETSEFSSPDEAMKTVTSGTLDNRIHNFVGGYSRTVPSPVKSPLAHGARRDNPNWRPEG